MTARYTLLLIGLFATNALASSSLEITTSPGRIAHILPSAKMLSKLSPISNGPLVCHVPCQTMMRLSLYEIFASPAHLQDGSPTGYSAAYQPLMIRLAQDFAGQGLLQIATQYFKQTAVGGPKQYVRNAAGINTANSLAGAVVDPTPYPASSGCNDADVPNGTVNCINDTQIQTAIQASMAANGWTAGPNKAFVYFTSSGEGVCFAFSANCAYTTFCGYHSYLTMAWGAQMIYAVIPYAMPSVCIHSAGTSPNGDAVADQAAAATAHEIMEMVTRSITAGGTGWFDAAGNEIMDKCVANPPSATFGQNTYDGGLANQEWGGDYYELPMAWNNHAAVSGVPDTGACDQNGPVTFH